MRTIGLLGGMSWESSAIYYKLINERVKEKLGKLHSAKSIMYSVDFQLIKDLQFEGKWSKATVELIKAAKCVEKGGGDFLIICTNTMHKMAEEIQGAISIPVLHIADTTGEEIEKSGIRKIGLLATKFTMEQEFYKGRLQSKYGIDVIIPNEEERIMIHDIIYNELCLGDIRTESRQIYKEIIDRLIERGAEGIILGCTEITMLIKEQDINIPVFDTTKIHAIKAADYAMNK
ncbi:aspartate/glutamate racemase family protein [Bacillus carboniphilus]|uniref:Aspartate/glutamate racemase family protein n=1 Tax=Bacillus carboniphilus TaxID=86663 RepID=A0ABY9JU35_9BACI|nr:aspartate/glutamate racemase family protein [Bacillus carboniphilus]WLR42314.1 aspartate/glutamate racemase family protein [Bacillus carboniphilus]